LDDLINSVGNPGGSQLSTFSVRVNPQGALPCPVDQFGNLITSTSCAVTPPLSPAANARSYRFKDWAIYGQDSFRLTPRLSVNYGLRYEHYGVQHNNNQSLDSNFYYGSGDGIEQQVQNGQVQLTQKSSIGQFWAPRWGTAAPRLGFALISSATAKAVCVVALESATNATLAT
jgi:outer membrane receptor protein involved in Fe transport